MIRTLNFSQFESLARMLLQEKVNSPKFNYRDDMDTLAALELICKNYYANVIPAQTLSGNFRFIPKFAKLHKFLSEYACQYTEFPEIIQDKINNNKINEITIFEFYTFFHRRCQSVIMLKLHDKSIQPN